MEIGNVDPTTDTDDKAMNASTESAEASADIVATQPRTHGGFVMDDDEDEDENRTHSMAQMTSSNGELNVERDSNDTAQRSDVFSPSHALLSDIPSRSDAIDQPELRSAGEGPKPSVAGHSPSSPPANQNSLARPASAQPKMEAPRSTNTVGAGPAQPLSVSTSRARLPRDVVGMLEDRIKEDPRGDLEAWLSLINEHKKRNKPEDVRASYDRFFEVFPSAAEQWVAYIDWETEGNNLYQVEQIFGRVLRDIPDVQLWLRYLGYVRRRQNLTTDMTGEARKTISLTYDFVLDAKNIGMHREAGEIWKDYIDFIRTGPGQIGGTGWQDQQKMDLLRKTFQKAICIPLHNVNALWKEYDTFEMGLNKMTGRKFLQEKSPSYVTARSSAVALQNITKDLVRSTLPRLPPALGFDGDVEFVKQVEIWKKWIDWEKEDPLVLKDDDEPLYKTRILNVYRQAVMTLRFWPGIWFDAAEFCFGNGLEEDGNKFLSEGTKANPESCLLAFKRADRIEATTANEEGEEGIRRRGETVREPYNKVLGALYDLINKLSQRESQAIAHVKDAFAATEAKAKDQSESQDIDDDEDEAEAKSSSNEAALNAQIEAIQRGNAVQSQLLSRTISFAWIALMRAMRRIQGKGKVGEPIGGSRQVFTDARKRGRLTSDVYIASALIEYHCYKDPAATKIFDRGMKLFPTDEQFALEYLKHLVAINDVTNARAVFETTVNRLVQKPETVSKAKLIFSFFHSYESRFGELAQVQKLEERMRALWPEDPLLLLFSQRHNNNNFNPTAIRPIVSPTQARPKALPVRPEPAVVQESPRPTIIEPQPAVTDSPKRPLEEPDSDFQHPRKIPRGESPLKGAAGRRLDAAKRTQLRNELGQNGPQGGNLAAPPSLPREVMYLLSIIPRADTYRETLFDPEKIVELIGNTDLSRANPQNRNLATSNPISQSEVVSNYNFG